MLLPLNIFIDFFWACIVVRICSLQYQMRRIMVAAKRSNTIDQRNSCCYVSRELTLMVLYLKYLMRFLSVALHLHIFSAKVLHSSNENNDLELNLRFKQIYYCEMWPILLRVTYFRSQNYNSVKLEHFHINYN